MTACGTCHLCGRTTGCAIDGLDVSPGFYRSTLKVWQCHDCNRSPVRQRERAEPGPRVPGETRQEWRRRMRGGA